MRLNYNGTNQNTIPSENNWFEGLSRVQGVNLNKEKDVDISSSSVSDRLSDVFLEINDYKISKESKAISTVENFDVNQEPKVATKKKKHKAWKWVLLICVILVVGVILFFLMKYFTSDNYGQATPDSVYTSQSVIQTTIDDDFYFINDK